MAMSLSVNRWEYVLSVDGLLCSMELGVYGDLKKGVDDCVMVLVW